MDACTVCGTDTRGQKACRVCGTPVNTSPLLPDGETLQNGRYCLEQSLGQGGFGITYAAFDTLLQRHVAIKELFPNGASRVQSMVQPATHGSTDDYGVMKREFLEEARTLARFDHPSIVRVFDVFEGNNTAYMVMEFLRGNTLQNKLDSNPLNPLEVQTLLERLGEALSLLHSGGLLHRDIKPDNLFLTHDGRAVLIDFGNVRTYVQDKTVQHSVILTPVYAAPEQYLQEARFAPATDLYALGATLYHSLAGYPPPSSLERMSQKTPLPALPPTVPLALRGAIEAALMLKMQARPQSVQELIALLRAAPRSSKTIRVSRNDNLAKAVSAALEGSILELESGVYNLSKALDIPHSLTLRGAGRDKTTVVSEAEGCVLRFTGGDSDLEGLGFEHRGVKGADVLRLEGGTLRLSDCRCTGGLRVKRQGGSGLVVTEGAKHCDISKSDISQNRLHGVLVTIGSIEANQNLLNSNGASGLHVTSNVQGSVSGNSIGYNELHGIYLEGDAHLLLEGNTLRGNFETGVSYFDRSGGILKGNQIEDNGIYGIYIEGQASPQLERNNLRGNAEGDVQDER